MIFKNNKYFNIKEFSIENINTNDKRLSNLCKFVNILSKYNNILFIELIPYKKTLYRSVCNTSLIKSNLNYKQLPEDNTDIIQTIEDNRRNLDMIFIYIGRSEFNISEFEEIYNLLYSTKIFIITHNIYNKSTEIEEDNISGIEHKDFEKIYRRSYIIKGIDDI
jgi:hypothetical protein